MYRSQIRAFHFTNQILKSERKRASEWKLPDLSSQENRRTSQLNSSSNVMEEQLPERDDIKDSQRLVKDGKLPPKGWRKNEHLPVYMRHKYALREKASKLDLSKVKRLSPSTAKAIRLLHDQFPDELKTERLAEFFKVSPVAIAKILKSRWTPTAREYEKLEKRWEKRVIEQVSQKMMENKFLEFIDEKERKLRMEIPGFFKEELYQQYLKNGIENVKDEFDSLNESRIHREKQKNENISDYVNSIIESTKE